MTEFTKTLDVRPIPVKEKHNTIIKTLQSLNQGEVLELLNDHDPRPLRYQLDAEFPNQFGWEYIEQGPENWKIAIKRK